MSSKFLGAAIVCFSCVSLSGLAVAQADTMQPRLPLTAAACQPLTAENKDLCCAAENWNDLVLKDETRFCPRLNATDTSSGRLGQGLVAGAADEVPTGSIPDLTEAPVAATDGNPGNDKSVGSSGEKAEGGMAENDTDPASGNKGKSN